MKKMMVLILFSLGIAQLQCQDESLNPEENNNLASSEWNDLKKKLSATEEENNRLLKIIEDLKIKNQNFEKNIENLAREKAESEKAKLAVKEELEKILNPDSSFNLEDLYQACVVTVEKKTHSEFFKRLTPEEIECLMIHAMRIGNSDFALLCNNEKKQREMRQEQREKGIKTKISRVVSYWRYPVTGIVAVGLFAGKASIGAGIKAVGGWLA